MPVKPIPDGYHTVTPYLYVIDFYKKAFGAEELMRFPGPDGRIGHAEIRIGDSPIMLADEHPEMNAIGPQTRNNTTIGFTIYVPDVDQRITKAIATSAKIVRPVQNQFYGDRSGTLTDPFGHTWTIATHVEDVPPAEMERRAKAAKSEGGACA